MLPSSLMFHVGRSGSRVVAKLLDQHPEIDWQGESLQRPVVDSFKETLDDPASYTTYKHLAALSENRSASWLGLEVKFYHLAQHDIPLANFIDHLQANGTDRFIILRRKNLLRKIISSMVGREHKRYHLKKGEKPKLTQITINPTEVNIDAMSKPLTAFLNDYSADFDQLDSLLADRPTLSLTYEDDISADPRLAYRKICEFMDLEPGDPEVPFGKTNPFPMSDIVTNLDEVREALAGTTHAWMVEDN